MTTMYKGFRLVYCFCGYPEKAFLIYWGNTYKGCAVDLPQAWDIVDGIIKEHPTWYRS